MSFLSRLGLDRGVQVLVTISPDETVFAVMGEYKALTLKNVAYVTAHEPHVVRRVGEDVPTPYGEVRIDLFRGGAMPIPQSKLDVLAVFFMHALQQLLGGQWARGFSVTVSGASSLADALSGYQEEVLRQALRQPLTGARKITFERHTP